MKSTKYFKLQEEIARRFGAKPTEAHIIATIKTSLKPISLEEIAKQTQYSLATVSTVVRRFEAHGFLCRVKKPGLKKIFVEARKDYLEAMKERLEMIAKNTEMLIQELPEIINKTTNKEEKEERKKELKQAKKANQILTETIHKITNQQ